jgi:RNA polymerase sigma factor (sigma-70 family)
LSRKETDAADLVQQTFCTWAAKGHQLRDRSKVKTWLFTTLYHDFISRKRHQARFVDLGDDGQFAEPAWVEPVVVEALDAVAVQEALLTIDDRYRAPVVLFYMKQHSYREIAEILDIPIGTVMSRLARGKALLCERLADAADVAARQILPLRKGRHHG